MSLLFTSALAMNGVEAVRQQPSKNFCAVLRERNCCSVGERAQTGFSKRALSDFTAVYECVRDIINVFVMGQLRFPRESCCKLELFSLLCKESPPDRRGTISLEGSESNNDF